MRDVGDSGLFQALGVSGAAAYTATADSKYLIGYEEDSSRSYKTLDSLIDDKNAVITLNGADLTVNLGNRAQLETAIENGTDFTLKIDGVQQVVGYSDKIDDSVTIYTLPTVAGNSTILAFNTSGYIEYAPNKLKTAVAGNWVGSAVDIGKSALGDAADPFTVEGLMKLDASIEVPANPATDDIEDGDTAINTLITAAVAAWSEAGFDISTLETTPVSYAVGDLSDDAIAAVDDESNVITLDPNAGGVGWHVDDDLSSDEVPDEQIDLYSVIAHEIGHLLGFEHVERGLLAETIDVGLRESIAVNFMDSDKVTALTDGLNLLSELSNKINDFVLDEIFNIDLPFGTVSIEDLLPANADSFIGELGSVISSFKSEVENYFNSEDIDSPSVDGLLVSLRANGYSVERSLGGDYQFDLDIPLLEIGDGAGIDIDLESWSVPGLPFDLPFGISGDYTLPVSGGISLTLGLGLDSANSFYMENPSIEAAINLGNGTFDFNQLAIADDAGTKRAAVIVEGDVSSDYSATDWISVVGLVGDVGASSVNRAVYDADTETTTIWLDDMVESRLDIENITVTLADSADATADLQGIINRAGESLLTLSGEFSPADLESAQLSGVGSLMVGSDRYDVAALQYSAEADETTFTLADSIVGTAIFSDAVMRKAFGEADNGDAPFALELGIFELEAGRDGFIELSAEMSAGVTGRFYQADVQELKAADLFIGFTESPSYAVYIPVGLGGVLADLMEGRGYISAFSENLPEDMSFTQFVYSLPTSVSFDGFESLFEMKTISLDMILAALEGALEEMVGINKDVYVDQGNTNNVYEQRYLETAVTAQYTKANGVTASDNSLTTILITTRISWIPRFI